MNLEAAKAALNEEFALTNYRNDPTDDDLDDFAMDLIDTEVSALDEASTTWLNRHSAAWLAAQGK